MRLDHLLSKRKVFSVCVHTKQSVISFPVMSIRQVESNEMFFEITKEGNGKQEIAYGRRSLNKAEL